MIKPVSYTLAEWELIIWAYAYEFMHLSIASDQSFDWAAARLPLPTAIPDFSPGTGMWVQDVVKHVGHDFLRGAVTKLNKIGSGAAITHIRFPEGWLNEVIPWELPTAFSHIEQEGLVKANYQLTIHHTDGSTYVKNMHAETVERVQVAIVKLTLEGYSYTGGDEQHFVSPHFVTKVVLKATSEVKPKTNEKPAPVSTDSKRTTTKSKNKQRR